MVQEKQDVWFDRESWVYIWQKVFFGSVSEYFFIQDNAIIPEVVNNFNCMSIDGDMAAGGGEFMACVQNEFLCFGDVKEEVTVHRWVRWATD